MMRRVPWVLAAVLLIALPFVYRDPYPLHILVLVLVWSVLYTSWSMMGRFGLVSLGMAGSWASAPMSPRCCGTTYM
jgi:branched-chain amino acid transport system permease protein